MSTEHWLAAVTVERDAWATVLQEVSCTVSLLLCAGGCLFPSQWSGRWFQSGVPHLISINTSVMETKGQCVENLNDKYVIEDKKRKFLRLFVDPTPFLRLLEHGEVDFANFVADVTHAESHDKIDSKCVYTEVAFAIGSELIMYALEDSGPIANSHTARCGETANEQTFGARLCKWLWSLAYSKIFIGPYFIWHALGNSAPTNEHFTVRSSHALLSQKGRGFTSAEQSMGKRCRLRLSSGLKEMFEMTSIITNACINPPLYGLPDALTNPWSIPECFATFHNTVTEDVHIDKTDIKRVWTEVTFAIGAEFIMHALEDSEPIANLQGHKMQIPYCQVWGNTGVAANEQTLVVRLNKGLYKGLRNLAYRRGRLSSQRALYPLLPRDLMRRLREGVHPLAIPSHQPPTLSSNVTRDLEMRHTSMLVSRVLLDLPLIRHAPLVSELLWLHSVWLGVTGEQVLPVAPDNVHTSDLCPHPTRPASLRTLRQTMQIQVISALIRHAPLVSELLWLHSVWLGVTGEQVLPVAPDDVHTSDLCPHPTRPASLRTLRQTMYIQVISALIRHAPLVSELLWLHSVWLGVTGEQVLPVAPDNVDTSDLCPHPTRPARLRTLRQIMYIQVISALIRHAPLVSELLWLHSMWLGVTGEQVLPVAPDDVHTSDLCPHPTRPASLRTLRQTMYIQVISALIRHAPLVSELLWLHSVWLGVTGEQVLPVASDNVHTSDLCPHPTRPASLRTLVASFRVAGCNRRTSSACNARQCTYK
ncbi:hypothetical protein PR048_010614 [Dryococelus australis]|uniref:DUF7044 domain-containing protein n=1 Tax=Dryococelus australis TaxID=614101 RepID=A0ABQ9I382_9NEOP|nr:hypothetical protein PR048_010614 [Dryococelus australis]